MTLISKAEFDIKKTHKKQLKLPSPKKLDRESKSDSSHFSLSKPRFFLGYSLFQSQNTQYLPQNGTKGFEVCAYITISSSELS